VLRVPAETAERVLSQRHQLFDARARPLTPVTDAQHVSFSWFKYNKLENSLF